MPAPLRIAERSVGDTLLLKLTGHLVFDEGDRILRDRIHEAADAGSRRILLDLHDVTYVDSGGIGAVVELYLYLARIGGRLALMCPGPCAQRVMQITHLISALDVFDDEASAIRGIHAPTPAHP